MRRRFGFALGALALGWLASPATAAEPVYTTMHPGQVVIMQAQADPKAKPEPAPMPKDATPVLQSCDMCGQGCCDDGHGGAVVAGIGFYYIQPHWDNNPAYVVNVTTLDVDIIPGITFTGNSSTRVEDFSFEYDFAPRIWVGYVSDSGLGGRLRWWRFEDEANAATVNSDNSGATTIGSAAPLGLSIVSPGTILGLPGFILPNNQDVLAFSSKLQLDVWDLEATQDLKAGNWGLVLSGGIRYTHMSQSYNASRTNSTEGPLLGLIAIDEADYIRSGHNFTGWGPTGSIELRRQCGDSGLALFANGRGSLLFGHAKENAFLSSTTVLDLIVLEITDQLLADAATSRDDVIPVAELEIGLDYSTCIGNGATVFGQLALVGQTWFGAGNAANNETLVFPGNAEVADNHSNLGFFGISASAGINY